MRAVSYERVSSDMQIDGYSLETQQESNRAKIEQKGWTFVQSYRDEGQSAKTTDRDAFQQMVRDAKAGRFDVIVVYNLSRFSRSVTDMLVTLRDLKEHGVSVCSTTEDFDFTTPIGRIVLVMLAAFAEWYLNNLAQDVSRSAKARALAGFHNGTVPFGYSEDLKKEGGSGIPVPDDRQAEGVRIAFQLYATGQYSDAAIAQKLHQHGYRPAGRNGKRGLPMWSKDSVSFMLFNRFYAGYVRYKETWYPGLHEAIIDDELYEAVHKARAKRRVKKLGVRKRTKRIYLLSGIVRCARCGSPMRVNPAKSHKYIYYSCNARERSIDCDQPQIPLGPVEEAVARLMRSVTLPDDGRERATEQARQARQEQPTGPSRAELEKQLQRLANLYKWGHYDNDAEYHAERREIEQQLLLIEPAISPDLDSAAALLADFDTLWNAATRKEQQQITQMIVEMVYLEGEADDGIAQIDIRADYQLLFDIAEKEKCQTDA